MRPDKIYLPWEYAEIDVLPPGVTTKQVFGKDVCYIRKDYLLEWAKKLYEMYMRITDQGGNDLDFGKMNAFSMLINKLNEL